MYPQTLVFDSSGSLYHLIVKAGKLEVRSGTLGPETQSSNFPFWAVRHPAWSPKGGSLLVRSSKFTVFTPLGKHRIPVLAAHRNTACRIRGSSGSVVVLPVLGESTFTVGPGAASTWGKAIP